MNFDYDSASRGFCGIFNAQGLAVANRCSGGISTRNVIAEAAEGSRRDHSVSECI
jgi:hypothetical protein